MDNPSKEFWKVFTKLASHHRPWDIWKDFILMFACALSNPVDKTHYDERENLYLRTIRRYNREERFLFPQLVAHTVMALELNPEQDFLGDIFMRLGLGNEACGQFFTPYSVSGLMAAVTGNDFNETINQYGYITINDCCCGAGAMLIAAANESRKRLEKQGCNFQNHVLLVGQDIDYTTALMCYIQLSLLGVAAYVKIGDSLTDPIRKNDAKDNYWFTPMYFSQVWTMRRIFHDGIM